MDGSIEKIMEILPQRYPFLMIDRIIDIDYGKNVTTCKNVSINDWFMEGHFPSHPIMPGVLIIEAMAQTAILLYYSVQEGGLDKKPQYYLGSVRVSFHNSVYPGDQLKLNAQAVKIISTGAFVNANAYVGDKKIAEAELIFAVKK